jgi:hypothetical protein
MTTDLYEKLSDKEYQRMYRKQLREKWKSEGKGERTFLFTRENLENLERLSQKFGKSKNELMNEIISEFAKE